MSLILKPALVQLQGTGVRRLPMLGQRVGLALPFLIDGEFGEALSECERLKTSSSHRSSHLTVFGGFSRQRENGPIESTERG